MSSDLITTKKPQTDDVKLELICFKMYLFNKNIYTVCIHNHGVGRDYGTTIATNLTYIPNYVCLWHHQHFNSHQSF